VVRRHDQCVGRTPFEQLALDRDRRVRGNLFDHRILHLADFLDQIDGVERYVTEVRRGRDVRREIGGDDLDGRVAVPRLFDRPLQSLLRTLRALDSHDDAVRVRHIGLLQLDRC
jgi:hypothetical protein